MGGHWCARLIEAGRGVLNHRRGSEKKVEDVWEGRMIGQSASVVAALIQYGPIIAFEIVIAAEILTDFVTFGRSPLGI